MRVPVEWFRAGIAGQSQPPLPDTNDVGFWRGWPFRCQLYDGIVAEARGSLGREVDAGARVLLSRNSADYRCIRFDTVCCALLKMTCTQ